MQAHFYLVFVLEDPLCSKAAVLGAYREKSKVSSTVNGHLEYGSLENSNRIGNIFLTSRLFPKKLAL